MRLARSHAAIEVHAEGEQGTCYLGSIFEIPGRTAREKLHHVNTVDDTVRRLLTHTSGLQGEPGTATLMGTTPYRERSWA